MSGDVNFYLVGFLPRFFEAMLCSFVFSLLRRLEIKVL